MCPVTRSQAKRKAEAATPVEDHAEMVNLATLAHLAKKAKGYEGINRGAKGQGAKIGKVNYGNVLKFGAGFGIGGENVGGRCHYNDVGPVVTQDLESDTPMINGNGGALTFSNLPLDILVELFNNLDPGTAAMLGVTCKDLYAPFSMIYHGKKAVKLYAKVDVSHLPDLSRPTWALGASRVYLYEAMWSWVGEQREFNKYRWTFERDLKNGSLRKVVRRCDKADCTEAGCGHPKKI